METESVIEPLFKNFGFEYDQKVHQALKIFLGFIDTKNDDLENGRNVYDKFCEILQETRSVIYDDFILNVVSPFDDTDGPAYVPYVLDILATYSGAVMINDFIKTNLNHIFFGSEQDIAIFQPYKDSIERNHKVQSQIIYNKKIDEYSVCINIVDDDPSHVVSRQYVSFLQILFDGEHVKATHIEDVKNKKGTLKEEYLPLIGSEELEIEDEDYSDSVTLNIEEKINQYRLLGFEINYDTKSKLIGRRYLYGADVSEEEHFVLYLYHSLVTNLVKNAFTNMLDVGFIDNEDITCADIYLRWFYLEKPTMKEIIKIIKKIVRKGKFLLPLWIQGTYKEDEDNIVVALLVNSCSLYTYFTENKYDRKKDPMNAQNFALEVIQNDIDSESQVVQILKKDPTTSKLEILTNKMIAKKYLKNNPNIYALVRLIKKIMSKKYSFMLDEQFNQYDYEKDYDILMILLADTELFENYFFEDSYSKNESEKFREFSMDFIQSIGFKSEEELSNGYSEYSSTMLEYYNRITQDQIVAKTFKNYTEIAKYEKYISEKEEKEKSMPNTRDIPPLNIVKPSRTHLIDYNEEKRMHDQKCINASNHSLYDINAYLKGKRVRGYTMDGKKNPQSNLLPVNQKDAMKRLIFFVASSKKLDDLTPFCYNLDLLTKDIGTRLYVECKDYEDMKELDYLFGQYPVIKLDLEFAVYVPLSEILDAIYNTQKQVFVLVPTEKVFKYTASMAVAFGTISSRVSGHHCQEGSNKQLHTIKVCKGSKENACWPVNEAIKLNEVYPNSYFMKQKFYIWSKSENSMDAQFTKANQTYINNVRKKREAEMRRLRVERGEPVSPIQPDHDDDYFS